MGYYIGIIVLFIAAALQISLLPLIRIGSGQPDLVFLLVISWAVHADLEEGFFWAFLGGILVDITSIAPTGTSVIGMIIIVYTIKSIEQYFYRFSIIMLVLFVLLGTVIQHIILLLVLTVTGYQPDLTSVFSQFSLPTLGYNLVIILPLYFILRRIQVRLPRPQSAWDVTQR